MAERLRIVDHSGKFHSVIPNEWKRNYANIYIKKTSNGQEWFYGINKKDGSKKRLGKRETNKLDKNVYDSFGYSPEVRKDYIADPGSWDAKYSHIFRESMESRQLKNEVSSLRKELRDLKQQLADAHVIPLSPESESEEVIDSSTAPGPVLIEEPAATEHIEPLGENGRTVVEPPLAATEPSPMSPAEPVETERTWNNPRSWFRRREVVDVVDDEPIYEERTDWGALGALMGGLALVGSVVAIGIALDKKDDDSGLGSRITSVQTTENNLQKSFNEYKAHDNDRDATQKARLDHMSKVNRGQNREIEALKKSNTNLKLQVSRLGGKISIEAAPGRHIESLESGGTIWSHVEDDLESQKGAEPSISQVEQATDKVLKINGNRWQGGGPGVDAHKLPVGYKFQVPNNIG